MNPNDLSPLAFIQRTAETDPVEAATLLVQSTTTPDPSDPLRLPWTFEAAIGAYRRVVGPLTDEQVAIVKERTR